jgi:DNA-binding NarL/FixJ family response regulator
MHKFRTVVIAEYLLLAELVADALREDRRLELTAVVGEREALRSSEMQEAVASAHAIVYVPDRPIDVLPWREIQPGERHALILADLTGVVGLDRALRLGARGYVGPREPRTVLVRRVLEAAEGMLAAPPDWVAKLQAALSQVAREEPRVRRLNEHELELMRWVARGDSAKRIAVRLRITLPATRSRIRRMMEKLGVQNERELAALAALAGFYPGEGYPGQESLRGADSRRLGCR